MSPRVPDYLGQILEAIARIERYTTGVDETAFLNSELVQDAVIRNIETNRGGIEQPSARCS